MPGKDAHLPGATGSIADSCAVQLLSDCWLAALGYRPAGNEDTLQSHGARRIARIRLARQVRETLRCHLPFSLFRGDIPFGRTVRLLQALALPSGGSGPVIYLAPGRSGVQLAELLLARDYSGPGSIHLIRYPPLAKMAASRHIVHDLVSSIVAQFPASPHRPGLLLAGFSLGAHLMLEAACRLADLGQPIAAVILINSYAFPSREQLKGINRRLGECMTAKDLAYFLLWRLSATNQIALQTWSIFVQTMEKAGLEEIVERIEVAISGRVRTRAWLDFQPARYPGMVHLLRASQSTSELDEGWSALSGGVRSLSFSVSDSDFLKAINRRHVVEELSSLASKYSLGTEKQDASRLL